MRPSGAFLRPCSPIDARVGDPLVERRRASKASNTAVPPRPRVASSDGHGDHSWADLAPAPGDLAAGASCGWTPGGKPLGGRASGGIAPCPGLPAPGGMAPGGMAPGGIIPGGIAPGGSIPGGTAPGGGIIPSGMGMPLGPCLSRCWGRAPGGPPSGLLSPPLRLGSIG